MYKTSTDYEKLWELIISGQKIFCFDYHKHCGVARVNKKDEAEIIFVDGLNMNSTQGQNYIDKVYFMQECGHGFIEFIDPDDYKRDI